MKKAPLVIISLLILVCISGCGKKTVTETKSYAASEITALHINASSWNVALSAGSENAVDIDISGSISKGEEAPAISLSDGALTILQVSEDSGKNEVALGKKGQITVTIPSELTVPIEIKNGYGDMEINHISAPQFLLNNEAGYVNFTNIETDTLQVSTTSGDITINSSFIPDISITSSSGYINLKQTEYVDCSLTAKSGEINIANAVSHGNLSLQTGSGDISISYQDKPDSLTFDVASGSEDLSVNFTSADYHIETSARKQGVIGKGEYQLTLSCNGTTGGCDAFYQDRPFTITSDAVVLIPKFNMNAYIAMFIIAVIQKEKFRYAYGRKMSQDKMKRVSIRLPSKMLGGEYEPDWSYMENYIKSLPYSSAL